MNASVLIVTTGRSGYSYLANVLRKNCPEFYVLGQIFRKGSDNKGLIAQLLSCPESEVEPLLAEEPLAVWNRLCSAVSPRILVARIGITDIADPAFWSSLSPSTKIVHLIRGNVFETFLSHEVTKRAGIWHTKSSEQAVKIQKIRYPVSRSEAVTFIENRKRQIEATRATLADQPCYSEIYFEDISRHEGIAAVSIEALCQVVKPAPFRNFIPAGTLPLRSNSNVDQVLNYFDVADLDTVTYGRLIHA